MNHKKNHLLFGNKDIATAGVSLNNTNTPLFIEQTRTSSANFHSSGKACHSFFRLGYFMRLSFQQSPFIC